MGLTTVTLLLNATYEPLCVVSSRRAVVLILAAKAVAVQDTDQALHSVTTVVAIPAVVRLTRYVRVPYPAQTPLSRKGVFARDGGALRLLRRNGDEHRPRGPAQPRGTTYVGQRGGRLPALQPHQGRPHPERTGVAAALDAADPSRDDLAGAGPPRPGPTLEHLARVGRAGQRLSRDCGCQCIRVTRGANPLTTSATRR